MSPPDQPSDVPPRLVSDLEEQDPEILRRVAAYARALAVHRETTSDDASTDNGTTTGESGGERDGTSGDATEEVPSDRPTGVPAKASITVKTINDNRYYYWQWRDGDAIKSKYEGPAGEE